MQTETTQNQPKYLPKTLEAMKLVDAGLTPLQALQATNFKKNISPAGIAVFKRKYKKHSLTAPTMVKLAHNAIKDCLTDQPIKQTIKKKDKDGNETEIIEEIPPTWTNKVAAASMVYDRVEPAIRQNANLNLNVDVHPVDLQSYLNSQSNQVDK